MKSEILNYFTFTQQRLTALLYSKVESNGIIVIHYFALYVVHTQKRYVAMWAGRYTVLYNGLTVWYGSISGRVSAGVALAACGLCWRATRDGGRSLISPYALAVRQRVDLEKTKRQNTM